MHFAVAIQYGMQNFDLQLALTFLLWFFNKHCISTVLRPPGWVWFKLVLQKVWVILKMPNGDACDWYNGNLIHKDIYKSELSKIVY